MAITKKPNGRKKKTGAKRKTSGSGGVRKAYKARQGVTKKVSKKK